MVIVRKAMQREQIKLLRVKYTWLLCSLLALGRFTPNANKLSQNLAHVVEKPVSIISWTHCCDSIIYVVMSICSKVDNCSVINYHGIMGYWIVDAATRCCLTPQWLRKCYLFGGISACNIALAGINWKLGGRLKLQRLKNVVLTTGVMGKDIYYTHSIVSVSIISIEWSPPVTRACADSQVMKTLPRIDRNNIPG